MKMEIISLKVFFCVDIKKCDDSKDKLVFINFCEKYILLLLFDCKFWKIKDIVLFFVGYFVIFDFVNIRLKIFDYEFVYVISKIV